MVIVILFWKNAFNTLIVVFVNWLPRFVDPLTRLGMGRGVTRTAMFLDPAIFRGGDTGRESPPSPQWPYVRLSPPPPPAKFGLNRSCGRLKRRPWSTCICKQTLFFLALAAQKNILMDFLCLRVQSRRTEQREQQSASVEWQPSWMLPPARI